jgi:hypothetical protein
MVPFSVTLKRRTRSILSGSSGKDASGTGSGPTSPARTRGSVGIVRPRWDSVDGSG